MPKLAIYTLLWCFLISCDKSTPNYKKIAISGSNCYGPCPAFGIEIDSSNHIRYFGGDFAKPQGFFTGHFPDSIFLQLNMLGRRFNPDTLRKKYAIVADAPIFHVRIRTLQNHQIETEGSYFPKPIDTLLYFIQRNIASATLIPQKDSLHLELMPYVPPVTVTGRNK